MAEEPENNDQPLVASSQIYLASWPSQPLIVCPPEDEVKRAHRKGRNEFVFAVLALILTGIIPVSILYHEQQTHDRQAQALEKLALAYVATSQPQLITSRAQLVASLLPSIAKGTPKERESAFFILNSADSYVADGVRSILEKSAATPQGKKIAVDLDQLNAQAKKGQQFSQYLQNARVYQRFGDFAQAYREYARAADIAPARNQVTPATRNLAKSRFDAGSFQEAAKILDQAFDKTSSE